MPPLIDLTGQTFNYLKVIRRVPNDGRYTAWYCKCLNCNSDKEFIIRGSQIKNGKTKSCGCLKIENTKKMFLEKAQEHIGEKYNHLTILEPTKKRKNDRKIIYKCQCDCSNKTIVYSTLQNLKSNHLISCGCQSSSRGENLIKEILINENINFEQQKTFDSCRFPETNALARFDFYVNNQYIIEFDGKQHFISYDSGWSSPENLKQTQKHDRFKNQWCKENNIPIIRIPYTHLENISIEDLCLETSHFLIKE